MIKRGVNCGEGLKMETDSTSRKAFKRLEEYGEQFMRMFDDNEGEGAQHSEDDSEPSSSSELQEGSGAGPVPDRSMDGAGLATDPVGDLQNAAQPARSPSEAAATVVFGGARGPERRARASRKDWKLFMSPRAADVHRAAPAGSVADEDAEHADADREIFSLLSREVEVLGAAQLGKKERRQWEQNKLTSLGAKPAKAPRTPLNLALALRRAREKEAAGRRDEDIAVGNIIVKGSGAAKKRALKKEKPRDGFSGDLDPSGGKFKGGVLFVKPMEKGVGTRSKKAGQHDRLAGFGGATRHGAKGGQSRKKASSKKKGKKVKRRR